MSTPEAEPKNETGVQVVAVASLDAEKRSSIAWALVSTKVRQGEGLKESLLWAIRNGARLPDDLEFREWFADVLEGKLDPKRGRGRPRKRERCDMIRAAVEEGIAESYARWLALFELDRDLAWLRVEAMRLRQEHPDAAVWRRVNDLGTEEGRQSFEKALADLGARPCPQAGRGAETARELALKATVAERAGPWKSVTDRPLTSAIVARLTTRARKSK